MYKTCKLLSSDKENDNFELPVNVKILNFTGVRIHVDFKKDKILRFPYCTWSFLVTRSFYWYQNICPCDLGHQWNWPLSGVFVFHKHILYMYMLSPLGLTEGDETEQDRDQKILERAKKRALSTSMLRELREELNEGPTEIRVSTLVPVLPVAYQASDTVMLSYLLISFSSSYR